MMKPVQGPVRAILWGWALLAVLSLAFAGLALIVPAASKMPFLQDAIQWPEQFFQKGLVVHVVLSFVVWYLATFGFMAQLTPDSSGASENLPLDALGLGPSVPARGERERDDQGDNCGYDQRLLLHLLSLLCSTSNSPTTAVNARSDRAGIDINPSTSMYSSLHETPWRHGEALSGTTPSYRSR